MAEVKLQNINKVYENGVQAVFDFNLDIKDKEFIVFVGPSGCGKSTTLRMIAGLEEITSGKLYIDGRMCNDEAPKDRDIAMVFQSYALYPHMTVYNNMAFGLKMRRIPSPLKDENGNPVMWIDTNEIKDYQKQIKKINKSINYLCKTVVSYQKQIDKELIKFDHKLAINEIKHNLTDEQVADIKAKIVKYNDAKVRLEQDKEKKIGEFNERIAHCNRRIQYFTTTQVQKYKYIHYPKEEIDARVHEAAKILEMEEYLDRKPGALSGGQRQRVALGRVIVRKAKVFLMDEPLSNLDAKLRVQMRTEIIKLHEQIGATSIYVTHDQTEAMTMATRIVVMKKGYIQQIGTPKEIYAHPANLFVAGFIGAPMMNFQDVVYTNGKIKFGEHSIPLNKDVKDKLKNYEGKTIVLGIRPEDILVNSDEVKTQINAEVSICELLGSELLIHFNLGETSYCAKVITNKDINQHDKIKVSFNVDNFHFFDKETEKSIL